MKAVSISETKNRLSALLDEVKAGETVVITDRGIPVARLERVAALLDWDAKLARLERAGIVRRGRGDPREVLRLSPARVRRGAEGAALGALLDERRTGW